MSARGWKCDSERSGKEIWKFTRKIQKRKGCRNVTLIQTWEDLEVRNFGSKWKFLKLVTLQHLKETLRSILS